MRYVDVILPLPLEGVFTYGVPEEWAGRVAVGMRVQVPLGVRNTYTAMVSAVYDECPPRTTADGKAVDIRNIVGMPDDSPVLLPSQLRLWQWIADYYLSPLGDVYKAALPAGLKQEDGYRPRTETYIRLTEPFRTERAMHVALDMLGRARSQQHALSVYLSLALSDPDTADPVFAEVTREELMNESQASAAVVKALVDRHILEVYEKEVGRLDHGAVPAREPLKALSAAQEDAYNRIQMQFLQKRVVLLHGVTSSGKTEIYIHLIQKAIDEGKQVLYLLPEIALTVQMMDRLRRVFGRRLGIYHSRYSDAERVEIWQKQLSDHPYDVILGARSAVFLPFRRLGLVIVDEEHETSFKQQDPAPRYHARSVATVMAQMADAKVLLGTATPSAESMFNACQGKYGYVSLTTRYRDVQMPEIQVVDVKDLRRRKMMPGPLSPPLIAAMRRALENKQQVILFQNRRGFAPMVECRVCGWVPHCQNCDVSLTLHKNMNQLTCHYCGYTYTVPATCPCCGSNDLRGRGYGTEKVEDAVRELFPEARIARMDLDTTRTRNAYERIISEFSAGHTNVLIGTQMVSKGLDFDRVAVVGILDADTMLNYPDFRAYEHAFTMMAQVSGRAGRRGERGLVMLQTRNVDQPVIRQVVGNDYDAFYADLMEEREAFRYPPFYHLVYVNLRHAKEPLVESAAIYMGSLLRQQLGNQRVLGPDKPAVARVKALHLRKLVLKLEHGIDLARVRQCLRGVQQQLMQEKRYGALQIYYDVDPM